MLKKLFAIAGVILVVSGAAYFLNAYQIVNTWNVKDVFDAMVAVSALVGLFGGIPYMRQIAGAKPSLDIQFKQYRRHSGGYDYISFEIENRSYRSSATDVECIYVIYDEDNLVVTDNHDRETGAGYIAPKTTKVFETTCAPVRSSTSYKIYAKVTCAEGVSSSRRFPLTVA